MRTEKMRQDNIRKVFGATAELFANNGVANTNLDMIAEKAGVSLRSVVNYFGKKEKLIQEMRKHFVENGTQQVKDAFQNEGFINLNGKDKIIETVKFLVEYAKKNYLYICALIEMRSMEPNPKEKSDEIIPPILELHDLFTQYLGEGMKDGSITNGEKFTGYIPLLIIMVKGFVSQYATVIKDKDKKSLDTFAESVDALHKLLNDLLTFQR